MKKIPSAISLLIGFIILCVGFTTWGFPWELPSAKIIVQQYLNETYIEPMEVIGAARFLRNNYIVTAREINNQDIVFTVTLGTNKTIWKDDYVEKKVSYEISKELNLVIDKFNKTSYAWAYFTIDYFYGDDPITLEMPKQDMVEKLADTFTYIVRYTQNINATNYTEYADFFYACIACVQRMEYQASDLVFSHISLTNSLSVESENKNIRISMSREEYMQIKTQEDIISYIEKR